MAIQEIFLNRLKTPWTEAIMKMLATIMFIGQGRL